MQTKNTKPQPAEENVDTNPSNSSVDKMNASKDSLKNHTDSISKSDDQLSDFTQEEIHFFSLTEKGSSQEENPTPDLLEKISSSLPKKDISSPTEKTIGAELFSIAQPPTKEEQSFEHKVKTRSPQAHSSPQPSAKPTPKRLNPKSNQKPSEKKLSPSRSRRLKKDLLKDEEFRAMFLYLDKLLAGIPQAKIKTFAHSPHYDVYLKILEKLSQ